MPSDIVADLRSAAPWLLVASGGVDDRLLDRAADEIARLREALEGLGERTDTCVGHDLGRRCRYCQCDGRVLP